MSQEHQEQSNELQYPLDPNSYKILHQIGDSLHTEVYRAVCIPNNSLVVIKSIDVHHSCASSILDSIYRKTNTRDTLLSHPNLLSPHCSFINHVNNRIWVIVPFMSAGSLQSIITSHSFQDAYRGLPEPCIAIILKQTLNALAYLHNLGRYHRDIKPSNILIDDRGIVKLADYGFSASIYEPNISISDQQPGSSSSSTSTDDSGSPYWIAPEVLSNINDYSFKADIWAFGITALELAYGRPPISHLPPSQFLFLKLIKRFPFWNHKMIDIEDFSRDFNSMISLCLDQRQLERPSAENLLNHSFFKNCEIELDFLVHDVLKGLNDVDQMFREYKLRGLPMMKKYLIPDEEDNDKKKVNNLRGWEFNKGGFELVPVLTPTESRDDHLVAKRMKLFGNEIIIPLNFDINMTIKELQLLSRKWREQSGQLINLIRLLDPREREEADALTDKSNEKVIKDLRVKLEREKKRNYELEMRLENEEKRRSELEMQLEIERGGYIDLEVII